MSLNPSKSFFISWFPKDAGSPSGDETPGQNEAPYTNADNMEQEGLSGNKGWSGAESTWDSPDRRTNPEDVNLDRDGHEPEATSDLSQGSLGYQTENQR